MTDKALCELATERHPDGPLAAINALLKGLVLRHADDSATLAALITVHHFHLPNLLDDRDAELRDAVMRPCPARQARQSNEVPAGPFFMS